MRKSIIGHFHQPSGDLQVEESLFTLLPFSDIVNSNNPFQRHIYTSQIEGERVLKNLVIKNDAKIFHKVE